jgi:N-acetylglucosaminyl-diphospho-decaprenol L-rhamnosyltransferase
MNLLIVIVNYRTGGLTVDCLRSLSPEMAKLPRTTVVVADNDSGDGSLQTITTAIRSEGWDHWASAMPLDRNGGFAFGNNQPIAAAMRSDDRPEYVLLLNPDTRIRPGAVRELLNFMESHPHVGIAGSRLEDPDGTPQRSAFRFPSIPAEIDAGLQWGIVSKLLGRHIVAPPASDTPHRCDWVAAASMIIRQQVIEDVGLMDEGFFMYFEETDFCRRAARRGWPCWYVPASRVIHLVGQASGVTDPKQTHRRRPAYWFESRRRYFLRNHGWAYAVLADVAFAICFVAWRVRRAIQRKPDRDPPKLLGDFMRHSVIWGN